MKRTLLSVMAMGALPMLAGGCGSDGETRTAFRDISWSKRFGHANDIEVPGFAVDRDGSVVVSGRFLGSADFGGGTVEAPANNYQGFVVKYGPDGRLVWQKIFGDVFSEQGIGVGFDAQGAVVIAGNFGGTVDFGGGPLHSIGATDIFVVKLDRDGKFVWNEQFGDIGEQALSTATVDRTGAIILAGTNWSPTFGFGGELLDPGQTGSAPFVAKLDANGHHVYSRTVKSSYAAINCVTTDAVGDAFFGGSMYLDVDFGSGPVTTGSSTDGFVAKLDASGDNLWTTPLAATNDGEAKGITVMPDGSLAVSGYEYADAGDGYPVGVFTLFQVDADGRPRGPRNAGGLMPGMALDAVPESGGSLIVTGQMLTRDETGTFSYSGDAFVGKVDPSGAMSWEYSFGDARDQQGVRVAVDSSNHLIWLATGFGPEGFIETFLVKFD